MRRWKRWIILGLALSWGALGCGSSNTGTGGITIVVSPATGTTVVVGTTTQFTASVTGTTNVSVTWQVNGVTGGNLTTGTINSSGLFTAPAVVPNPATVTVAAISQANSNVTANSVITIDSGVSVLLLPTTATVGTGESFTLTSCVTGIPSGTNNFGNCDVGDNAAVTWTVTATTNGSFSSATGITTTYIAPATVPSPATVTVTATSAYDTTKTATLSITLVTATNPTLTSVSPTVAGLGSVFQDAYIAGTGFISTTQVFINGTLVDPSLIAASSSTNLRVRIPASDLNVPPTPPATSDILTITASRQGGTPQNCSPDPTQCQIVASPQRPGVVGPTPNSIAQGSSSAVNFNVNGGFFGTKAQGTVNVRYNGQNKAATISTVNPGRQMAVTIGGSPCSGDLAVPGLYPVEVRSSADPTKVAVANLAVQPDYTTSTNASPCPNSITAITSLPVGASASSGPIDVAINTATGIAVVVNQTTNDVTLIDLTQATPVVVAQSICTANVGATAPCPTSGPTGVAIDNLHNLAYIANNASNSIAVVDLAAQAVTQIITTDVQPKPYSIGINPITQRAVIAYTATNSGSTSVASLMDLTQSPPAIIAAIGVAPGASTRIAVDPNLNWAMITAGTAPGGGSTLEVVDLSRSTMNFVAPSKGSTPGAVRASGTVTVTLDPNKSQPIFIAQPIFDMVLIQGMADTSFDGTYLLTSVNGSGTSFTYQQPSDSSHPNATSGGGTVSWAEPLAQVAEGSGITGVAINPETQKALLLDPTTPATSATFFNLLDQSSTSFSFGLGAVAGAFNPLTNVAVIVNDNFAEAGVIDPETNDILATFDTSANSGAHPTAIAIDPGTNLAVVANQADNDVLIVTLGAIRTMPPGTPAPAILQSSPKTFFTTSTLSTAPSPGAQSLTIIGKNFTSSSVVRLDGAGLSTHFRSDRMLTADVPPNLLSRPRRFAVDVLNPGAQQSNASDFTVIQAVDVSTGTGCTNSNPAPAGVAIDPQQNLAVVSLANCNTVALINVDPSSSAMGTGQTVAVGTNPQGVAVLPSAHLAVVANNGSGNASVVDELAASVSSTVTVGAGPVGVAVDRDTGEAATANSQANTISVFSIVAGPSSASTLTTSQQPVAVVFDYTRHQVASAAAAAGSVDLANLGGSTAATSTTSSFPNITLPTAIVFDPVSDTYLVTSSLANEVLILNPANAKSTPILVGIDPIGLGYNYLTSTLVTANGTSRSLTVVDFLDRKIRAVLSIAGGPVFGSPNLNLQPQYNVDVHPLTNLAVISDSNNNRVLLMPLPR